MLHPDHHLDSFHATSSDLSLNKLTKWKRDGEIPSPHRIVIMAVKDEGTFQLKKTARDTIR